MSYARLLAFRAFSRSTSAATVSICDLRFAAKALSASSVSTVSIAGESTAAERTVVELAARACMSNGVRRVPAAAEVDGMNLPEAGRRRHGAEGGRAGAANDDPARLRSRRNRRPRS